VLASSSSMQSTLWASGGILLALHHIVQAWLHHACCLCTFQHLQEPFSGVVICEVVVCLMMFYII